VLSRAWTSRCETTIWSISSRSCPGFGGRVAVPLVRPRLMPSGHSSVRTRSTAGRATWLGSRWPLRTMAPAIAGPSLSIEYTLVTLDGVFEDPQIRAPGDALAGRARQPGHHRRLDTRHPLASVTASSRLAASTSQLGGGADLTERGPVQDRLGGIDDAVADAGKEACPCGPRGAVGARHPPGRLVVDEDVRRHGAVPPCLGCLGRPSAGVIHPDTGALANWAAAKRPVSGRGGVDTGRPHRKEPEQGRRGRAKVTAELLARAGDPEAPGSCQ
jgi:hypothetical protein